MGIKIKPIDKSLLGSGDYIFGVLSLDREYIKVIRSSVYKEDELLWVPRHLVTVEMSEGDPLVIMNNKDGLYIIKPHERAA